MFVVSTDSCADLFKSYLKENKVECIMLKRIANGKEFAEIYNSYEEYEAFYRELREGALPTTSQLNQFELEEYFLEILHRTTGDIIHVPLSSGLSGTCESAVAAAQAINSRLDGRKIYVADSLSASLGMGMQVELLVKLRDSGATSEQALKRLEKMRENQHIWAIIGNLFHLKRGGRISGVKAAVGTFFKIKPIVIVNSIGKLAIENTLRGEKRAIKYVLDKMKEYGATTTDYKDIYIINSSAGELTEEFERAVKERFANASIKRAMVGPVVGTHVGEGTVAVVFEGNKRLDTNT